MFSSLQDYVHQVENAWQRRDGNTVSNYISLSDSHIMCPCLQSNKSEFYINSAYSDVLIPHLTCVRHLKQRKYEEAYSNQLTVMQSLVRHFKNLRNDNWLMIVVNMACLDLRMLTQKLGPTTATVAELEAMNERTPIEKTAEAIMAAFRVCAADNRSTDVETKRWGLMMFANQLFKVYFKMGQLHLMKPLIRAVESSPFKDRFPVAQQVTYKYYAGLKGMTDGNYKGANKYLTFAFEHCHKSSKKNKQFILINLIPVRMFLTKMRGKAWCDWKVSSCLICLLHSIQDSAPNIKVSIAFQGKVASVNNKGYMPSRTVLEKYDLLPLWNIVKSVKDGRVSDLIKSMTEYRSLLCKFRVYTAIEKLRMITYRNLFKKVFLLHKTHLIDMHVLMVSLQLYENAEIDLDETHCILANLIYEGKVKGYISLSHQKVVLSKVDPFPKLTTTV